MLRLIPLDSVPIQSESASFGAPVRRGGYERMASDAILVLIADDDDAFRRGVSGVLAGEPDIEVVAQASDGEEAVALVTEHAPHVVLMDVRMPSLSGIDAARVLNEIHPSTKVVMLTVSDEDADLFEAMKAGACGYLLKDAVLGEIGDVVREVRVGNPILSPVMASKLFAEFASMVRRQNGGGSRPQLTNRELQVLRHMTNGLTTADVARRMCISENAVRSHLRNLVEKFHIHARIETALHRPTR